MWPKKSVTLWFALLILSLACASSFAAEKLASATSPDVLKQQITESERSLKDLETLVQACGNCSEEAQLSGSLAELRQYIAYLHVRLDSIRQEVALKKPAPKPGVRFTRLKSTVFSPVVKLSHSARIST